MVCKNCITRRCFLKAGVQASAASIILPISALISSCGQVPTNPGNPTTSGGGSTGGSGGSSGGGSSGSGSGSGGGGSSTIPNSASNIYTFSFSDYSQLQSVGGSVQVVVAATSGTKSVAVTRVSAGVARTVSTTCTHAGCTIGSYSSGSQQYTCACHGSIFNSDGTVNTGPAVTALTAYSSVVNGSDIQVTIP